MKKIFLLAILMMTAISTPAQLFKKADKNIEPQYAQGSIPVINGKVTFEETIPVAGITSVEIVSPQVSQVTVTEPSAVHVASTVVVTSVCT